MSCQRYRRIQKFKWLKLVIEGKQSKANQRHTRVDWNSDRRVPDKHKDSNRSCSFTHGQICHMVEQKDEFTKHEE